MESLFVHYNLVSVSIISVKQKLRRLSHCFQIFKQTSTVGIKHIISTFYEIYNGIYLNEMNTHF